jgi:hypothetical protein
MVIFTTCQPLTPEKSSPELIAISFFFLICIVGGGIQGPLDTAATNGLLCQPRMIMMME